MQLEKTPVTTEVRINTDFLDMIGTRLERIEKSLVGIGALKPQEFLSPGEFCKAAKISRWQFDMLKGSGSLQTKKVGRKVYVSSQQLQRYFNGEITIK
jgi:hypothetical protein